MNGTDMKPMKRKMMKEDEMMKTFAQKSRESYNRKADDYDSTFDGRFTRRFKELLLEKMNIKVGDFVLDVACGNGTFLKMASDRVRIKGFGIDISEKMIDNARKKCPEMTFEVNGCDDIRFEDGMFDVITVVAAYHHFPDVSAFAKEAERLLKPKGLLYIAEVTYPFLIRAILNPFIPLSKAGDVRFYTSKEITKNFQAQGFAPKGYWKEGHIQIVELQK
jgi:ubiquinone/menaquinone biosynthesis C-methylase UbiE